jgi:hypothetical protein
MVKKFFEGIKDDIKDTIAPPQKALVVIDESEGVVAPAAVIAPEGELPPPSEGYSRPPGNDAPLKALPVEPLEDDTNPDDEYRDQESTQPPRPIRAIPVESHEVIEEGIEEP